MPASLVWHVTLLAGARKLLVHKETSGVISTIISFSPPPLFILELLLIFLLLLLQKSGDFVGCGETPWLIPQQLSITTGGIR